ncbi:MAG: energy-coupling factor transporter transmembrane protein EcfT [Candidatus Heimdallarchaeota archaeon]|nr:energy-coupling factor transporter transmembrane protein EcfT [Candidatus Heimdallarchaeota archaeon]
MSLKILDYFNYGTKKSILHHVDPRGKFLFVIVMTCITILFRDLIPLLFITAFIIPLIFMGRFFKKWFRALLTLLPLVLLIIILNALFLKDVVSPTTSGIAMALRFVVLTATFGLFFQTVSPDDISQMLVKFKFPYSLAWAISTAYRFIPTIAKESSIIIAAQKSRGLQIDRGRLFKRLLKMIPLLIPIFGSAFHRSWQLAEAIESRGWNAVKKRTYLYNLSFKWLDYLIILFALALFALFLLQAIKNYELPLWMKWHVPEKYELKVLFKIVWDWIKGWFSK